jgi:protein FAM32A
LTEAQKRHEKRRRELEVEEMKKAVKTTYRQRIEKFNEQLATRTEHNDIPRVSAAGNG